MTGEAIEQQRARGAPTTGLHNASYLAALQHLDDAVARLARACPALT